MREDRTIGGARVPGLQRRRSGGALSYRLRFRVGGRRASITYAAATSDADARDWARGVLRAVARGEDPRRPKVRGLTVLSLAAAWVRGNRRRWRGRTAGEAVGALRRCVLGTFGDREANSITRAELRLDLKRVAGRHPVTANRLFALWRSMYRWALRADQEHLGVTADPTAGLDRPGGREEPRSVTYSD
ncbi:MAG TPA: hypothetical protein VMX54_19400, partial [Vicinamibacteria bacterium]|nr:hypothetical protein [Vicinamibacteria bacterium]